MTAIVPQGKVQDVDLSAAAHLERKSFRYLFSSNVAAFFVPLFFSGPAVRYNAEFTKRIPVTGLGGFSDLIISIIFLHAYLYYC